MLSTIPLSICCEEFSICCLIGIMFPGSSIIPAQSPTVLSDPIVLSILNSPSDDSDGMSSKWGLSGLMGIDLTRDHLIEIGVDDESSSDSSISHDGSLDSVTVNWSVMTHYLITFVVGHLISICTIVPALPVLYTFIILAVPMSDSCTSDPFQSILLETSLASMTSSGTVNYFLDGRHQVELLSTGCAHVIGESGSWTESPTRTTLTLIPDGDTFSTLWVD